MFSSRTNWTLHPNRLTGHIEARRRQGRSFFDLTESNPTRCGFSVKSEEFLRALADPRALTYEPDPRGLLPARQAVASYYAERGVNIETDQIFLTTSTSEAYTYLFRLLADPGDNILVPRPSYPLFEFLAGLNDLELLSYPLIYDHEWHVDRETLAARLNPRTRAILVVHPNNPTGSFLSKDELGFLLSITPGGAAALIADEVFADYELSADARRVTTLAGVDRALTFVLSGLSKISALPQMKLAWIVVNGPADLRRKALERLEIIADMYLSVSAPLACSLPAFLAARHTLQAKILGRLRSNLAWLDAQITPGMPMNRLAIEGGWYAILRVPSVRSDEEWTIELLDNDGVLVHPGHFYDFSSEGYLVVSLLTSPEVFQEGISKVIHRICAASSG
ncbi:MAG TPA: pyridoxal phosphate-dependent aminotransferase [Terriglobia bacterium]|nr:pyridoxal phosphate-dependent aminotransferase [Terriglobia bacterium]